MIIFGAVLLVLYLIFWAWHSPWAGKLTNAEIDHYLAMSRGACCRRST